MITISKRPTPQTAQAVTVPEGSPEGIPWQIPMRTPFVLKRGLRGRSAREGFTQEAMAAFTQLESTQESQPLRRRRAAREMRQKNKPLEGRALGRHNRVIAAGVVDEFVDMIDGIELSAEVNKHVSKVRQGEVTRARQREWQARRMEEGRLKVKVKQPRPEAPPREKSPTRCARDDAELVRSLIHLAKRLERDPGSAGDYARAVPDVDKALALTAITADERRCLTALWGLLLRAGIEPNPGPISASLSEIANRDWLTAEHVFGCYQRLRRPEGVDGVSYGVCRRWLKEFRVVGTRGDSIPRNDVCPWSSPNAAPFLTYSMGDLGLLSAPRFCAACDAVLVGGVHPPAPSLAVQQPELLSRPSSPPPASATPVPCEEHSPHPNGAEFAVIGMGFEPAPTAPPALFERARGAGLASPALSYATSLHREERGSPAGSILVPVELTPSVGSTLAPVVPIHVEQFTLPSAPIVLTAGVAPVASSPLLAANPAKAPISEPVVVEMPPEPTPDKDIPLEEQADVRLLGTIPRRGDVRLALAQLNYCHPLDVYLPNLKLAGLHCDGDNRIVMDQTIKMVPGDLEVITTTARIPTRLGRSACRVARVFLLAVVAVAFGVAALGEVTAVHRMANFRAAGQNYYAAYEFGLTCFGALMCSSLVGLWVYVKGYLRLSAIVRLPMFGRRMLVLISATHLSNMLPNFRRSCSIKEARENVRSRFNQLAMLNTPAGVHSQIMWQTEAVAVEMIARLDFSYPVVPGLDRARRGQRFSLRA